MGEYEAEADMGRRRQLHDRTVREVGQLLTRRSELRGVYPMADQVAESIGWGV